MKKGRVLLLSAGTVCALAVVSILSLEARGSGEKAANAAVRADVVTIDAIKALKPLKMPAVTFLHDKHTAALKTGDKNCTVCHEEKDGRLIVKFKREKDGSAAKLEGLYHKECIGCHAARAGKGEKAGPLDGDCRSCHNAKPAVVSDRLPAGFTSVLHYRHTEDANIPSGIRTAAGAPRKDNCDRCHHEFDKATQKLVYVKGKERDCRECHLEKPNKDARSMAQAAHASCVNCHRALKLKGVKDVGPIECAGCHGKAAREKLAAKDNAMLAKIPADAPLIRRGQPDRTLIVVNKPAAGQKPMTMTPVLFNHKLHARNVASCRVCHHKSLEACSKCHTVSGSKEGGFVTLQEAMHLATSKRSCVGCHNQQKADPKCAGCHKQMRFRGTPDKAECRKCHVDPTALKVAPAQPGGMPAYWNMKPEEKSAAAARLMAVRKDKADIFATDDIPEKVTIDHMVNEYGPVVMPHRKIVLKLMDNAKNSKLAGVFHSDPGAVCQACHHHGQPGAKKPPRCANCHAKPFDSKQPNRPGLKAAYHDECMGCHKTMNLRKPQNTNCTGCHKERKK